MPESLPHHVAIVMDGNGRWARSRGLPRIEGHRRGVKSVRAVVEHASNLGVSWLTLFAFSSENWASPQEEVSGLMRLLVVSLTRELVALHKKGVRIRVLGHWRDLPTDVVECLQNSMAQTEHNTGLNLVLALNYGGQQEILDTVNQLLRQGASQGVDRVAFESAMPMPELPPVDLCIRTSGEQRISNFLLWHLAYAELYFTPIYWPEFREEALDRALEYFAARDRRFGGVSTT